MAALQRQSGGCSDSIDKLLLLHKVVFDDWPNMAEKVPVPDDLKSPSNQDFPKHKLLQQYQTVFHPQSHQGNG